jgi:hypothetical protein
VGIEAGDPSFLNNVPDPLLAGEELPTFKFELEKSKGQVIGGSYGKEATVEQLPLGTGRSVHRRRISPASGGLRFDLFHRGLRPRPDPPEHAADADPPGHRSHPFVTGNMIERKTAGRTGSSRIPVPVGRAHHGIVVLDRSLGGRSKKTARTVFPSKG